MNEPSSEAKVVVSEAEINPSMDIHPYRIEIALHHPTCAPAYITRVLGLSPWFARQQGAVIADIEHKQSVWRCRFSEGCTNTEFQESLRALSRFLEEHGDFFKRFRIDGGDAEVSLEADIHLDDGVVLDLRLDAELLALVARMNIHLRLRAWNLSGSKCKSGDTLSGSQRWR